MTNEPRALPVALERPPFGQCVRQLANFTSRELESCLDEARRQGERLGEILQRRNLVSRDDIAETLRLQAAWMANAARADAPSGGFPLPGKLSLCLPAFNEAENIDDTLLSARSILPELVEDFEVVVVDDGSSDGTGERVRDVANLDGRVRLVTHEQNRGYGAAVRSGMMAATGDLVAFMDSDGQFSPLDLTQLLQRLDGHDVVVGYRYQRADPWPRRLNAWAWGRLIRTVLGVRVRDLDCALKVFRREVVDEIRMDADGACINAEILVQCATRGRKICEVPVLHYPRCHGEQSGADLRVILRAFRELPRLWKYKRKAMLSLAAIEEAPVGRSTADDPAVVEGIDVDEPPELRICMLATCPFPANHGTAGSIREMSEALVDQGHDVHIVTYHTSEDIPVRGPRIHRISPLLPEKKVTVGPTARRPIYDLQMVFKALSVLRRHKFDVIHAHGHEAAAIAWICRVLTGIPVVYSGHNTMADELPSYDFIRPRWMAGVLARILDSRIPRLAERCIPHSKNLDSALRAQGLGDRTEPVIEFGVDLLEAGNGDPAGVREDLGLGDEPVVLYAGVVDRFQRLDLLLEAMVTVLEREPRAKLLIAETIANDFQRDSLSAQARELGILDNVVFTRPDSLDAVRDVIAACDLAVVSRPNIPGLPIKLINYMAAGKPCVLFASSTPRLTHRREAMLAPEDTGESLGEAILELWEDPGLQSALVENAHDYILEHHDRRGMARSVTATYLRALEARGRLGTVVDRRRCRPVAVMEQSY